MQQTILLVEDNLDVLAIARVVLEKAGYAVVTAVDGEEGLRLYQQHHSDIVLLLTDVTMPKMNGLDLADRILQIDSGLPVLLMSGDHFEDGRGFGHVAKPFTPRELVGSVGETLAAAGRRHKKELAHREPVH